MTWLDFGGQWSRSHQGPSRWRSGNGLVSINEFNLRWARLVLGWVTVSGFDSSRRRHFISVCNQPPRSTQPSTLRGTIKWVGYQLKCGDALRLGSQGRHGVFAGETVCCHTWALWKRRFTNVHVYLLCFLLYPRWRWGVEVHLPVHISTCISIIITDASLFCCKYCTGARFTKNLMKNHKFIISFS